MFSFFFSGTKTCVGYKVSKTSFSAKRTSSLCDTKKTMKLWKQKNEIIDGENSLRLEVWISH